MTTSTIGTYVDTHAAIAISHDRTGDLLRLSRLHPFDLMVGVFAHYNTPMDDLAHTAMCAIVTDLQIRQGIADVMLYGDQAQLYRLGTMIVKIIQKAKEVNWVGGPAATARDEAEVILLSGSLHPYSESDAVFRKPPRMIIPFTHRNWMVGAACGIMQFVQNLHWLHDVPFYNVEHRVREDIIDTMIEILEHVYADGFDKTAGDTESEYLPGDSIERHTSMTYQQRAQCCIESTTITPDPIRMPTADDYRAYLTASAIMADIKRRVRPDDWESVKDLDLITTTISNIVRLTTVERRTYPLDDQNFASQRVARIVVRGCARPYDSTDQWFLMSDTVREPAPSIDDWKRCTTLGIIQFLQDQPAMDVFAFYGYAYDVRCDIVAMITAIITEVYDNGNDKIGDARDDEGDDEDLTHHLALQTAEWNLNVGAQTPYDLEDKTGTPKDHDGYPATSWMHKVARAIITGQSQYVEFSSGFAAIPYKDRQEIVRMMTYTIALGWCREQERLQREQMNERNFPTLPK